MIESNFTRAWVLTRDANIASRLGIRRWNVVERRRSVKEFTLFVFGERKKQVRRVVEELRLQRLRLALYTYIRSSVVAYVISRLPHQIFNSLSNCLLLSRNLNYRKLKTRDKKAPFIIDDPAAVGENLKITRPNWPDKTFYYKIYIFAGNPFNLSPAWNSSSVIPRRVSSSRFRAAKIPRSYFEWRRRAVGKTKRKRITVHRYSLAGNLFSLYLNLPRRERLIPQPQWNNWIVNSLNELLNKRLGVY